VTHTVQLPKGWARTSLGVVARIRSGFAFKSADYTADPASLPLIRQSELRSAVIDTTNAKRLPIGFLQTHGHDYGIRKGDILVGLSGSLSSISRYIDDEPSLQNQRTGLLQISPLMNAGYILFAYSTLVPGIEQAGKGVAVQNVSPKQIEAMAIPIPPIPEQHRIVEAIESYLMRLDAAVALLERVQRNLKRYRASVLKAAVEGRLVSTEACLCRARHGRQAELAKKEGRSLPAPRPGAFYVYVIECEGGSHYIGQTDDIPRRWKEHIEGRGTSWTKRHPPLRLGHWEEYASRNEAVEREKHLKTGFGRKWLKREIAAGRTRQAGYEPASELLKRILIERRKKWIENAAEKARAKAEKKARKGGKPWTHADDIETLEQERAKAAKKYKEPAAPDLSALGAQAGTTNLPDLPEGWCWATIRQFGDHRLGKMLDKAKNEGKFRKYLRNVNVQWFHFDMTDIAQMRVTDAEFTNVSVVAGDVVVCEGGEPGRCSVWEGQEPIAIQKALHRIRVHPEMQPWFLAYHLGADALSHRLDQEFTGTTIKHFTGEAFHAHVFAVPPANEQVRIVNAVRSGLSLVDHISTQVQNATARASHLRQSILKWAFEGKLVEQDPSDPPASVLLEQIRKQRNKEGASG